MIREVYFLYDTYIPEFIKVFLKFVGVGAINSVIGFSFIMFFYYIMDLHYLLSNFLGYACGVLVGYMTHQKITFRGRVIALEEDVGKFRYFFKGLRKFSMVFSVAYVVQFVSLYVMVDWWGFWTTLSQALAIFIYVVISYIGNNFFTFKKVD